MGITEAGDALDGLEIEIWGIQDEFLLQHFPCASVGSNFASLSLSQVSINTDNSLTGGYSGKKKKNYSRGDAQKQVTQITLKTQKTLPKPVSVVGKW